MNIMNIGEVSSHIYPLNRPTRTRKRTKTVFETVEKPPVWTPENEKRKPSN